MWKRSRQRQQMPPIGLVVVVGVLFLSVEQSQWSVWVSFVAGRTVASRPSILCSVRVEEVVVVGRSRERLCFGKVGRLGVVRSVVELGRL